MNNTRDEGDPLVPDSPSMIKGRAAADRDRSLEWDPEKPSRVEFRHRGENHCCWVPAPMNTPPPCFPASSLGRKTDLGGGLASYEGRWLMLLLACLPYFLSSWAGFWLAANIKTSEVVFHVNSPAIETTLAWFFYANCVGTFLEPWIETSMGQRGLFLFVGMLNCVATSMAFINLVVFTTPKTFKLEIYSLVIIGFAQGIGQCPIINLANRWFKADQRTMCISVVMNMNNMGIGMAFIAPGLLWDDVLGYGSISTILLVIAISSFLLTCLCFEELPPMSPSVQAKENAERERRNAIEDMTSTGTHHIWRPVSITINYWITALSLFKVKGFGYTMIMNTASVANMNLSAEYFADMLNADFGASKLAKGLTGVFFWLPNVFLCGVVGSVVDTEKDNCQDATQVAVVYKRALQTAWCCCIVSAITACIAISQPDGFNGFDGRGFGVGAILAVFGNAISIPQPLSTDVALDVAHGFVDMEVESIVVCMQMMFGNFASALLSYMLVDSAEDFMYPKFLFPYVVCTAMTLVAFLPYAFFFEGEFKRSKQDILDRKLRTPSAQEEVKA